VNIGPCQVKEMVTVMTTAMEIQRCNNKHCGEGAFCLAKRKIHFLSPLTVNPKSLVRRGR
jgi:hypothetical protein